MDKNTLLAVILSGVIMVGWYAIFPPPDPNTRNPDLSEDSVINEKAKNSFLSDVNSQDSNFKSSNQLDSIE